MALDTFMKACGGDLYAVLALSTKQELDPLVQILTSKLSNFLEVKETYKRHHPDHTKYHAEIGDELRLYGGNTLANLARGGEGPSYDELVSDACAKLQIPYEKGRTVHNETNLLEMFLEKRWQALTPNERESMAAKARQNALGQTSEKSWYMKAGASALMIPFMATGGWSLLGLSMFDPSFKVTVPCILHIAYLRRKIIDEKRSGIVTNTTPSSNAKAEPERPEAAPSLQITDDDGTKLISFEQISQPTHSTWHSVNHADDGISLLRPIMQAVPTLVTAAEIAGATGTRYMEVVCSGDLMKAAKGGGFRAMSRGANGITEHANLFTTDKLATIANTAALMNVASVALAQKHLADISEKLSALKDDVGRVISFQQDGRRAVLTGAIHYFEQVAPATSAGEYSASVLGQIERHEADLIQVQHHLVADLAAAQRALQCEKDDSWFASNQFVDSVEKKQREISDLLQQLMLCLRTRALGWQLLCQFPEGEIGKLRRRDDILRSLKELDDSGTRLAEFDAVLRSKLQGASSFWSSEEMNKRKMGLLRTADETLKRLSSERDGIVAAMVEVEELRTALQRPFQLILKVEEGEVTGVQNFRSLQSNTDATVSAKLA